MARRTWKPSKAQIKREREATEKYLKASDQKQREALAGYPVEYQDAVIDAYRLMWNARDSLKLANSYKPQDGKPWESEGAIRSFKFYKAESDDFYAQYLAKKEEISKQFGIHSDTVAEHVKAVYISNEQVDNLLWKGEFK